MRRHCCVFVEERAHSGADERSAARVPADHRVAFGGAGRALEADVALIVGADGFSSGFGGVFGPDAISAAIVADRVEPGIANIRDQSRRGSSMGI